MVIKNFTSENVFNLIIDNYNFSYNTKENRENIIYNLNRVFFPDKIAKFIDRTTDIEIDAGKMSFLIEYNGTLYNLLAFQDQYIKINRKRKVPATTLLMALGLNGTEAVEKAFEDADNGEIGRAHV